MKNILFLLLFFYFSGFSQGRKVAVFDPATNSYVYTYVFDINNPPTPTYITGTIPFTKLTGSDIIVQESQVTNLASDLNLKAPLASPTFSGIVTLPALTITNAMLAGSIAASKLVGSDIVLTESQTTNLVTDLGNKQGISAGATTATTGTMTTTMTSGTQNVFTITPTGACTFNASGGKAGATATFVITTSGTSSFVLTWGTNFKTTATLATGTTTAKTFCVNFINTNGTQWIETGRTTAQ